MAPNFDVEMCVIKRTGEKEEFNPEKIGKVIAHAAQGLDINLDEFKKAFKFVFKDEITTKEIQETLIKTAQKLIYKNGEIRKGYAVFANRLFLMDFWKELMLQRRREYNLDEFYSKKSKKPKKQTYGMFSRAEHWIEHLKKYVELGVYDERILKISKDTLITLYAYAKKKNEDRGQHFMWDNALSQTMKFYKSYLIRYNGQIIETFDEALLLISILGFYPDYRKDKELFIRNVKKFYDALTDYYFVPATPQLLNLRRAYGNLSSCNIMDIKDNIESIYHALSQSALISKNAGGIGIYGGRLRPGGSYLMGNPNLANDVRVWFKLIEDTAIAVNQGGNRKGAITVALPIWHKDVIGFINSRNPLGEKRLKLFDIYQQIVVPSYFLEKAKNKEDWYLVDHYEIQMVDPTIDLIETWGDEFKQNYQKVERLIQEGKLKNYRKVKATELLQELFNAFLSSGFPYIFFEDNVNRYSPFKEKILCGNLCMESFSPFNNTNKEGIKPNEGVPDDMIGYVHSCNLFSLNLPKLYEDGILFDDAKLREMMKLVVRYMDNILQMANPPVEEIEKHNREYRTIGIGYLGFADLLVKLTIDTGYLYTYIPTKKSAGDESMRQKFKNRLEDVVKRVFGRCAFYGMLASTELAKERGRAPKFKETKWADGILLGRYDINKLTIGELSSIFGVTNHEEMQELVTNLKKYGIRNTMLFNCPPNTSTSLYAGTTASILPPYNLIQAETQKKGQFIVFPRYIDKGALFYTPYINFDAEDMYDIVEFIAMVQRYIDSGISFEYVINRNKLKGRELARYLLKLLFLCDKLGVKTLYYARSLTTSGKEECVACAN